MIEAFVTNLGKYVDSDFCGAWLKLPATSEDVKKVFADIGVDGVLYEEFFITSYRMEINGLDRLGEHESIDELNYLAELLFELDEDELAKFEAAAEYGEYAHSAKDLINLTQNLDYYDFFPDVEDEEDLGYFLIDEHGMLEIPDHIQGYFDYEAYGRDYTLNEGGDFIGGGYITPNYGSFVEYYNDRNDIPDEYKVFSYPDPPDKMPIKAQLEMYGKMAAAYTAPAHSSPTRDDR